MCGNWQDNATVWQLDNEGWKLLASLMDCLDCYRMSWCTLQIRRQWWLYIVVQRHSGTLQGLEEKFTKRRESKREQLARTASYWFLNLGIYYSSLSRLGWRASCEWRLHSQPADEVAGEKAGSLASASGVMHLRKECSCLFEHSTWAIEAHYQQFWIQLLVRT